LVGLGRMAADRRSETTSGEFASEVDCARKMEGAL
jgi:hypothetical protein